MMILLSSRVSKLIALTIVGVAFLQQAIGLDFSRAEQIAQRKYGTGATNVIRTWQAKLSSLTESQTDSEKLRAINDYFNIRVRFSDDKMVWGQSDYWATPLESLMQAAGDCEDFAIAKYFSLKQTGVAPEKLRLTYVKARIGGPTSNLTQAHMVLAYYATPDADPLILDNLINDIRPASRRNDLSPVFSFNSEGLWVAGGTAEPQAGGTSRLSRWQDLLARMQAEGFQ